MIEGMNALLGDKPQQINPGLHLRMPNPPRAWVWVRTRARTGCPLPLLTILPILVEPLSVWTGLVGRNAVVGSG